MKTNRLIPTAFAMAAAAALWTAAPARADGRAVVVFDHPERFSDVKDGALETDKGRDSILARIREFVVERAKRLLPEGDTLTLTFTDIDLAGDYEPWRGPRWDDVRVVKDAYPPAFKFTYAVTDASGKTVKQGSANIRDLDFMSRLVPDASDPLRYEKSILSDWLTGTLRGLK